MTAAALAHVRDIDPAPFVRRDGKGGARLELAVKGMRCAGCMSKIEKGVKALPGVEDARVNLSSAKLSVRWRDGRTQPASIVDRIGELGFEAFPYDPAAVIEREDDESRFLLRCLVVAGFAASNVMFLSIAIWAGFDGEMGAGTRVLLMWISGLVAVPAAIYSSRPFFRSAIASLTRGRANMDVPISLAILLALAMSIFETVVGGRHAYFDAAVSLPFLLLIGRYLDVVLRRKAQTAARDLIMMQTATATRINADGTSEAVAPRDIAVGDQLLLAAGERLPVDAVVLSGAGEADVSLVTGESAPVAVKTGDAMRAGSLMLTRALSVRASARVEDSLVAEVARMLEAGQQNRSRYVRLADKATALYVPLVHGAALSVFVGSLLAGLDVRAAATSAIALLIITCPCALGLAVPAVQVVATGRLFRRGLLVKSGDALERLAEADVAVFDKTGTITLGKPQLVSMAAIPPAVLQDAARLARASKHPLARALASAAGAGPVSANVCEAAGEGLEGDADGKRARLGRAAFVDAAESPDGASELWYRNANGAPFRFSFADKMRDDARQTIGALQQRGLEVELLSGDRTQPVSAAAFAAGISGWQAQTDPKQKVAYLEALAARGRRTLMVGDGMNDAAALAMAHVSISLSTAADASQAAADMVLQGEALAPIVEALDVARAARRLVLQNFAFAALYNLLAVPLAAFGLVTPLIAAVAMSASSLLVMANALRLGARG